MLRPGNHNLMRREGLKLVLLWLRDETTCPPEIVQLFATMIPLRVFVASGSTSEEEIGLLQRVPLEGSLEQEEYPRKGPKSLSTNDTFY